MGVLFGVYSGLKEVLRSFRGALLVQLHSLGFFEGRQFRAYREFNLAANAVVTMRVVATTPFMLTWQSLQLIAGDARGVIVVGATPTGTWAALPTVNPKYRIGMSPVSAQSLDVLTGTLAGGSEREVLLCAASTGGSVKSGLGATDLAAPRGLPAGTYYITITAGANGCVGIYAIEWEDL